MHIPLIAKENNILSVEVPSKAELGAAAGIDVSTVSVAVVEEGDAKEVIKSLQEELTQ